MATLITNPGHETLVRGITFGEISRTQELLAPMVEKEGEFLGQFVVAYAYLIGVRQGVHNERARRNRAERTVGV